MEYIFFKFLTLIAQQFTMLTQGTSSRIFFPGYYTFFPLEQGFFYQYALTGYFFNITPPFLPNPSEVKWLTPYQHQ